MGSVGARQQDVQRAGATIRWQGADVGADPGRMCQPIGDAGFQDGSVPGRSISLAVDDQHAFGPRITRAGQKAGKQFACFVHGPPVEIESGLPRIFASPQTTPYRRLDASPFERQGVAEIEFMFGGFGERNICTACRLTPRTQRRPRHKNLRIRGQRAGARHRRTEQRLIFSCWRGRRARLGRRRGGAAHVQSASSAAVRSIRA